MFTDRVIWGNTRPGRLLTGNLLRQKEGKKCCEIVRTCPECQLGKDYRQRHLPKGKIESSRPWDVVSIDLMGPFPYDDKAKRFIVTMMDVYSRYTMAIPVGNHMAQTVSKCLYEHVVAYFGVPRSILSDRGAEFTSCVCNIFVLYCNTKIALLYTSVNIKHVLFTLLQPTRRAWRCHI